MLKIDDSKPAYNFKAVVFPNEWQKSKRQRTSTNISPEREKYRTYYQVLIDELRESHNFTQSRTAPPESCCYFPSGIKASHIYYAARFTQKGRVGAGIYIDRGSQEENKNLFDALERRKTEITSKIGGQLEWERQDRTSISRIAIYRNGAIASFRSELEDIREWHIENLLKLKDVFTPEIKQALEEIE